MLLDGAVGTSLWEKADKYGFPKNPVWTYNVEHPEIVKEPAAGGAALQTPSVFGVALSGKSCKIAFYPLF